jgi:hypothetical protein
MNRSLNIRLLSACLVLCILSLSVPVISGQEPAIALQRGYRTGYSDGYMAGYRDAIDTATRDHSRHPEFTRADRAYRSEYGAFDDYRSGYQQGFESGYATGYERNPFESTVPTALTRRATTPATVATGTSDNVRVEPASFKTDATGTATIVIPCDTELILELQSDLSTKASVEGERFVAKVVAPAELVGATVEGRVSKIRAPGRLKRRSELLLSFDRIVLNDHRWSNFSALLTEVMPVKGDNIKRVDVEGTAIGQSSTKGDIIKVGSTTGGGALIGGLVGGPVGVAVGAGVGAAFGVGAVVIDRGKHINLARNQQLRVKTAYETQIR